ncbi:MAG: JAB domain-containing protein [Desulfuromonadales bacterium]|nr:JAB domain-containing protein [Desulfuromonadales bacterium]
MDLYDDIIDRSFKPENLQLKGTLYTSLDSNPDEEAGLHKLSQKTGLPVEALRKDRGAEARRRAALIDTESLPTEAPKTAEFVTAPENAALAHDDLSNLSALEKLVRAFRSGREQQEQGRLSHARMTGEISLEQADRFQGLERSVRSSQRMIEGASDFGLLDASQIAGQMWETASKAVPLALGAGMTAGGTAAVLGQVGPQVALPEEIITVPAAFATAFGTALTYGFLEDTRKVEAGHAYQELTQIAGENGESIDENTAAIAAQTVGVVNAAIEGLGLKIITAPYRKALKRAITAKAAQGVTQLTARRAAGRFAIAYGTQVAAETGQEIAQETVNVLAEEMAKMASEGEFETTTPEEVASRLWEIASKTASGMAWLGLPGAGVSLNNDLQAARAAQKNQQFMQALGETAKGSKLRERLPEKFRELVAKIKEGGPVENVYVPAEQWKTFWQEKGIDPAEMAQGLNYAEALATGADVVIPLEDYATRFAASEYHGELMRDVRLREDQMTPREAEEFQQTAAERFGSLVEEAEGDDSSLKVYEDVFGELIGIGRERSTAEREALLWQARYRARAERLGMDAFELYQQAPLKITRPLPEVLQRGTIDTSIDPYLDALRAGELPFADHGPSLLEFMRERGIADDRGDLASMEVDKGRKPFTRKLLREDGMSIDKAREAAVEAGYLSEEADINDLIQAVDVELRGSPVYAQGRMDEEAEAKRQGMEQLQEYLQSMGVDLAEMDNETVRKVLDQGEVFEAPAEYGMLSEGAVNEEQAEFDFDALPPEERNASGRDDAAGDGDVQPTGRVSVYRPKGSSLPREIRAELAAQVDQVQTGTFRIGLERIESAADAAHVLASLRKKAKENFAVLVTGGDNQPLAILDVSTGSASASIVDPKVFAGAILDVPGAKHVWFGHNHPTGITTPSREDKEITSRMADLLQDSGVEFSGHVILGRDGDYTALGATGSSVASGRSTAASRRGEVPVMDTRIVARSSESPISAPEAAADYLRDRGDGILLVNNKNAPVAWVAMDPEEMGNLRQGDVSRGSALLLRAASQSNAAAMIVQVEKSEDSTAAENVARFGNASNIRPLDFLAGGKSASEMGVMPTSSTFYQYPVVSAEEAAEARDMVAERLKGLDPDSEEAIRYGLLLDQYTQIADGKARYEDFQAPALFQTFDSEKRGSITFSPGLREISFFEKSDLSTFLHESGHAWLEELKEDAARDNAPEQVKEDWQSIAGWLGIDPDKEIPVASHETFARGIEAYILEGNAPSLELAPVFQRFKAWLLRIYKSLQNLNVTLNKDVRAVMDRLLATDEQIAQAEQMQQFAPLFADAAEAGMSETEFAAYRRIAETAHEEATRDLQQKLMAELSREQKKWWKEEREKVRAEVEAEAKKNPVYQAFQLLTKGEDFEGNATEGFKLAKSALVKMYGEAFVKRLPRAFQRVYTKKGGMHPDEAAEVFGFSSGDEMVQAMVNTPPMRQAIEAETDVRMRELYGDMMLDGSIADEAMNSVHSDQRGKVLQAELRALRKKQREVSPFVQAAQRKQRETEREGRQEIEAIPPMQAFRQFAAQTIGAKQVKDIRPDLYLKAEQKAGRLAFEAAAKKDYATAAEEKRKQLLNHFLFMEARKARTEAEKIYDYARKLENGPAQSRIGKAGGDYLDQINAILEKYEFKQVTGPTLAKRQSLLEWARQQEEMGLEAAIPQEVLDEIGRRNYKTLSIDSLRAVRDALKNIEHLSREANRIRIEGEEIELAEAVRDLSASANEHFDPKRLPIDKETRSWIEKKKETLSRLDASLIKAEQLIEWLDGGAVNGPWNRMIFEPLAKAQAREFDLTKEYTQKIAELFQAYGKEKGSLLLEKVYIPALGESLTRQAVLAVALNTGNASNYAKLLEGYQWTPEALEQILSHLDKADWAFVQSVWDTIETLWPEIAAMEKRLTGLEPPKVQAREFTNRHGTFRGGYYPVVYDPLHSQAGEKQTDARGEKLFDSTYVRATTEKGHTKARIEQAAYPILLSLEIIPQHLAQVIHDLTHREAVVNANRLLNKTKDTLNQTAGPAYARMLRQWLASVANDRNIDQTGNQFWTQFFTTLRINATIVGMGLRVTTMFTQIAGLSQSLDIVKGRYLAKGLKTFARSPFAARAWVNEKSGEMRHRSNALDRDVRDGVRKLMGKKGGRAWIQAKSFAGIALFDALVSTPTWIGGYEQARAEGLSEKEAVASGDRAVRLSQGAGGAKDLAAVQRSNDLMKLFTMFYSYFSVLYNRLRNMGRLKGIGEIDFMDVAFKSFVMVMFPAVVSELLANRGPDDDEEPAEWALRKITFYPFMTIPVVRDVANALESDYGYTMTPLSRALETASKLPGQIDKTLEGEKDVDDLLFQAWDLPGYIFGLPTGQAKKTTQYIWDVWNGDIQPEDGGDIAKGLLFGERRK